MCAIFLNRLLILGASFMLFISCSAQTPLSNEISDYDSKRSALISSDSLRRFSSDVILTQAEKKLNSQLLQLRSKMKRSYEELGFFPPVQAFDKYKGQVEATTLFKLLRKMPKGAIHHLHSAAAPDFNWLVDALIEQPKSYVYWAEPSTDYIKGQVEFFSSQNVPRGFLPLKELNTENSNFKDELYDLLTLTTEPTKDSLDIWVEFDNIFKRISAAYSYKPLYEAYMTNAAENLIDDGITHMETRLFIGPKYDFDASGKRFEHPLDTTIQILQRIDKKLRKKHPQFTHKLIYTSLRFFSQERISQELIKAFQIRKQYPELVKGFDLVAEEDNGNTTYHFKESWAMIDSLQQVYGVDMPLYLHDGESNSQEVKNMYDALLLNSKRIGHGFNLMNFPSVVEMIKQKDICIEVSPLSNQILGYVKDLRLHPASLMLRHGVQLSINSDDPGIFDYTGLSYDYWYAIMAWELDLKDIKKLIYNSVNYSTLSDNEKTIALNGLDKKWTEFVSFGTNFLQLQE